MGTLKSVLELSSSTLGPDKLKVMAIENIAVGDTFTNTSVINAPIAGAVVFANTQGESSVFLRNTDPTNFVTVSNTAGVSLAVLKPSGGVAFFVLPASSGMDVTGDTGACLVEFGFWSR